MRKRLQRLALAAAALLAAVAGARAWMRARDAREFSRPHQTEIAGKSVAVRLQKIVVGKAATGILVMVFVRTEDADGRDVPVEHRSFLLVDGSGRQYLPAGGEALSYNAPANLLSGPIWLQAGPALRLPVKNERPFKRELRDGEFRTFQTTDW
jgi:hypothetical protein